MLKMLEGNVTNMHKEIEKFSREVKTRRKVQKNILQIKIMIRDKQCLQSALE